MAQKGYVYILESSIGFCKIGCSKDPRKRLQQFNVSLPFKVDLLHYIPVDDMYYIEGILHDFFADKRAGGEWFIIGHFELAALVDCDTEDDIHNMIQFSKDTPDGWWKDPEFGRVLNQIARKH